MEGKRKRSRLRLLVIIAIAVVLPALVAAVVQVARTKPGSSTAAGSRLRVGSVAMSSPVDATARFFWELAKAPRSLIPLDRIISGGPPPDGIPAIDGPAFESVGEASRWLKPNEPVLTFESAGRARAYPLQILIWHEIVNDVVGREPVTVTYCPLCNSAIVFSRRAAGKVLDFGTSGRLFNSDLVMYDRQTKSMWPQIEGRAVVGPLIGARLRVLPSAIVSWAEWRAANPNGEVLSRPRDSSRPYGENPYAGYDAPGAQPFLFEGKSDGRLPAMERVLALQLAGVAKVYPYGTLARSSPRVVHDRLDTTDVVVFYAKGTASALDSSAIARARDVGATGVFRPRVGSKRLTFEARNDQFFDKETGSRWNLLGRATAGPLAGDQLQSVPHVDTFWFAWAAFLPKTQIWTA